MADDRIFRGVLGEERRHPGEVRHNAIRQAVADATRLVGRAHPLPAGEWHVEDGVATLRAPDGGIVAMMSEATFHALREDA